MHYIGVLKEGYFLLRGHLTKQVMPTPKCVYSDHKFRDCRQKAQNIADMRTLGLKRVLRIAFVWMGSLTSGVVPERYPFYYC